jgi:RNA polymerase sigma-70 factor (ECF subfamily)
MVFSERQGIFSMESDSELIESINKGDTDAFEKLYYRYRDWIYRLAWRFTGNSADALDVLQETFTYLLGKFPGFELTSSMTTFLYPAVRHISITISSKKGRIKTDEELLGELVEAASQETGLCRSELAAVLAILSDEQREVLLMRFVDDMSLQEIAAALNIPLGTVKSRLHNSLNTLRNDCRTKDYFLE